MYITPKLILKMEALGVSPKKSLGQNFLVSSAVIEKIVIAVQSFRPQFIIEVGPGLGSLTDELLKLGCPLRLIELDQTFSEYWRGQKVELIETDAMKWDWNQIIHPEQTLLVSNLPYQISASMVIERSLSERPLQGMILMFQKEVAERIMAKPKTEAYGLLSVMAQNFWNMSIVLDAGTRDFYPAPRVASRVLKFVPKVDYVHSRSAFLKTIKAGFSHRRKYLLTNLKALGGLATESNLRLFFHELGLSAQIRAEELDVQKWRELTQKIHQGKSL